MDVFFWFFALLVSLAVLIKSADLFIESAETIGKAFGVPSFIIGVTVVSIGTSLPELASAIVSVFENASDVIPGIVIGSNIANIALVIGLCAARRAMVIQWNLIKIDLPFLFYSAAYLTLSSIDGVFSFGEAILAILGYGVYLGFLAKEHKGKMRREEISRKLVALTIISAVGIYIGAEYTIISLKNLSEILGIEKAIIAMSLVALGTSLPELTVSFAAVTKQKYELSLGNISGSNIFNSLMVTGIPALLSPIAITASSIAIGLPAMLLVTSLLVIMSLDNVITRYDGMVLFLFYLFFVGKLFALL